MYLFLRERLSRVANKKNDAPKRNQFCPADY